MNFRNDTPAVGKIISIRCFNSRLEAKVESRYFNDESLMEELRLSGGAIIRRNKETDRWRMWPNGEVGERMAIETIELEVLS